jgi:hypothetical protein
VGNGLAFPHAELYQAQRGIPNLSPAQPAIEGHAIRKGGTGIAPDELT